MEHAAPFTGRRFHLLQIIGEGAFGEVYLAEQDSGAGFRRKVAIKLLHKNVSRSPEAGARMRDEARILGLLSHRNIVTVLDLVKLGERWAVIMEFVPGSDLEQTLDALGATDDLFPVAAALEVGAAVCAALHTAYAAQGPDGKPLRVVHRDIKPSNVRLTLDGDVKVLDFGVASVQLEARESSTRGSAWLGTERYMAPERILCESDDAPGDVYATAATIVELLLARPLGRTPVLDDRHGPFVEASMASIRARIPGELGDELTATLTRALAADPEKRPSAAELGDALRALSRRAEDANLVEFCRDVVATVPDRLGHKPRPASGVLSEVVSNVRSSSDSATYNLQEIRRQVGDPEGQSAPTLMPRDPPSESRSVSGIRRASSIGLVAILGGFGVIVGALIGTLLLLIMAGLLPFGTTATPDPPVRTGPVEPQPVEAPLPAVEVEPEPAELPEPVEPEPAPAPAEPAPSPAPARTPSPAPEPQPEPDAVPDPDAPRIRSALITLPDAQSLSVTCGGERFAGTASARLRNFPAGDCQVRATFLGAQHETTVRIDRRREVRCSVSGGQLVCQ